MIRLSGQGPLGRQVYLALRDGVLAGELRGGARLPSTRALAEDLGVSRTVTQLAYDQLSAEGYLRTRVGSGTYVADDLPATIRAACTDKDEAKAELRLSQAGAHVLGRASSLYSSASAPRRRLAYDFRPGSPPLGDFPHEKWRRMLGRQARRTDASSRAYGPAAGVPALREALAAYVRRARVLPCAPEQIIVTHGSQQALDLTARLLVNPGEAVAIEEPGYEGARNAFAFAGASVVPVPVDAAGLDVDELDASQAHLVYVTPSHQYPTGAVLSMPRRAALLDWAERNDAVIVEDDYDGEFRFGTRPLAPLQALDRRGRVLYIGTFSKVMFPSLRVGYLVVPPSLIRAFQRAKPLLDGGSSPLIQEALAEFVASGTFELYVRRLRRTMAERREALLDALGRRLGGSIEILGADAGLHLLLRFKDLEREQLDTLVRSAAERGVGLYSAAPYYAAGTRRAELVLGYAALTPAAIREGIRRMAKALNDVCG